MSDAASGVQSALRKSWILEDVYQLSDDGNAPDTISATVKSVDVRNRILTAYPRVEFGTRRVA
jgi:hypothetical protein